MPVIQVVGLGPGDLSSLPLGTMQQLKSGKPLFFRTFIHPVVQDLLADGLTATSFDELYESGDSFEQIYQEMAEQLLRWATSHDIVYAVPGHPLMAEQSVQNLLKLAEGTDVAVKIVSGQSFVDVVCALLQVDPIEGLAILDGTHLDGQQVRPSLHTLIVQVFNQTVASEVKLTLMDVFPDDYRITVVRAAGVPGQEQMTTVPLYELDHVEWIDHLTTVYIPPGNDPEVLRRDPWQVVSLVRRLREPGGCPWDQEQTHVSLSPYVLEEAYEVAEAIDAEDDFALADELGDLLLQVLLHAQIGTEEGSFDVRDVFAALADKLIRRHPHVFGDVSANSVQEAGQVWDAAKANEATSSKTADEAGGAGASAQSVLANIKWAQPAVMTSLALQRKTSKVGFDWDTVDGVLAKVREETEEVAACIGVNDDSHVTEEIGDLMFTVINLARWLNVDPEHALRLANRKFFRRFLSVEKLSHRDGQNFEKMSLNQLDSYWNQSKSQEKT